MTTIAEALQLARQHHQAGNLAHAEWLYRQVLQADRSLADVWCLLGAVCQAQRKLAEAEDSYRRALQLSPHHVKAANRLGIVLSQQGRHKDAIESFRQILEMQPDNAELHHNLGVVHAQLYETTKAIACFRQALRLQSSYAEAHYNLGLALKSEGDNEAALAEFQEAVRCKPDYVQALNDLGSVLLEQDRLEEARATLQYALKLGPHFANAHSNLGIVLDRQGKNEEAFAHFEEALRLDPRSAAIHNNIGNALNQNGRLDEAIFHFRQALALQPSNAQTQSNLGLLLMERGQPEEAVACFRHVIRLRPRWAIAHLNMAAALGRQDDLEGAVRSCQEAVRLEPDLLAARGNLVSCLNLVPGLDPDHVFAEHCDWGRLCEAKATPLPHANEPSPERRLRIGYVSGDFRLHALKRYLEPVLVNHDPTQVEIFCYAEVPFPDAGTARLKSLAHHWRSTCLLSDDAVAKQIRADGIDILVDLAGHTVGSRLAVFAHKAAPVQATWLGYMNTTGLRRMDYRLTDKVLDPIGQPVRDTEELLRLPSAFCCFAPPVDAPPVSPLPGSQGRLTFGSLNNLIKHNSRVIELWSKVLHALPTSRLLMFRHTLMGAAEERIRRQFADCGIGGDRLELRMGFSTPGYLAIFNEIDITLDTFPCTGGVTTCESLWMGAPVLTLCGERPSGRNSAALLARVGLSDWAVASAEDFVSRAVRGAGELEELKGIRRQLRERMSASLVDAGRFTRELEDTYRTIWRRWCLNAVGNKKSDTGSSP